MSETSSTNAFSKPTTIRPRNDFVLVEEAKADPYHTYRGYEKIIVPTAYEHGPEDRPVMGRIIAKGEACVNPRIAVNMIAMAGKWMGARFLHEGKTYVLIKETDVLATLE